MSKFRIEYDDQLMEVVEKIGEALIKYDLTIEFDGEGGDGYEDYKIIKLEKDNE
jgi:uncharacterized protein YkvS